LTPRAAGWLCRGGVVVSWFGIPLVIDGGLCFVRLLPGFE